MEKMTITATVETKRINIGTRSERDAFIVRLPDGTDAILNLNGANPFTNEELQPFKGQRVKIDGLYNASSSTLFVRDLSDITILGPAGRPSGPKPAP